MDIDNPSECPECERLGLTEVQQLKRRIDVMQQTLDDSLRELTNLKDVFAQLRKDRDTTLQQRNLSLAEVDKLKRRINILLGELHVTRTRKAFIR